MGEHEDGVLHRPIHRVRRVVAPVDAVVRVGETQAAAMPGVIVPVAQDESARLARARPVEAHAQAGGGLVGASEDDVGIRVADVGAHGRLVPGDAVLALGVPDDLALPVVRRRSARAVALGKPAVGLDRVPHAEQADFVVPQDGGTDEPARFPRLVRHRHRISPGLGRLVEAAGDIPAVFHERVVQQETGPTLEIDRLAAQVGLEPGRGRPVRCLSVAFGH